MFDPDDWLEIGKIVAPQGLRGEMRVYPNSDFPERFLEPGKRWLLRPGGDRLESVQLNGGRFISSKGLYVIQLDGINGREQAETLRNARLMVAVGDRPLLEDGEYHVLDLVGLAVYHQVTQQHIGVVRDVLTAGNDLLEVELLPTLSEAAQPAESDLESSDLENSNLESSDLASAAPADVPAQSTAQSGETDHSALATAPENSSDPTASEDSEPTATPVTSTNSATPAQATENTFVRRSKVKRAAKNAAKRAAKKANKSPTRVLIPFVEEIVPVVDLEHRRIEVLPPAGLIDANSIAEHKAP
ncbi:MAG: ribosome maturation factor RimM [Elainellaceae cyanobacterium]